MMMKTIIGRRTKRTKRINRVIKMIRSSLNVTVSLVLFDYCLMLGVVL